MIRKPSSFLFLTVTFFFLILFSRSSYLRAQSSSSATMAAPAAVAEPDAPARQAMHSQAWEAGPFFNGGVGTGNRSDYTFLSVGAHVGKLVGSPFGPGLLHGQFEVAGDVMPWWQGRTPNFLRANCAAIGQHVACTPLYPTGGPYNGISITPVIFRWNFVGGKKLIPFVQGAGGLIWTNHKYPPVGPYQEPGKQGASVWNFTPQFGVGFHYFIRPKQSITVGANAVHISSASLGDTNPGVNASVQFTVGYTWWK